MVKPENVQIASDASAKGRYAAFGGVLLFPDGVRLEVSGPTPRSEHQEATAALAVLRFLPDGQSASLLVDAQDEILRATLCITHPHVTVTRLPRNSVRLHERADELAKTALRELLAQRGGAAITTQTSRVAVYAVKSVDSAPRYAVAFWENETIELVTGEIELQLTKALTLRSLEQQASTHVPPDHILVEARLATPRHAEESWAASREQLSALRRSVTAALNSESGG